MRKVTSRSASIVGWKLQISFPFNDLILTKAIATMADVLFNYQENYYTAPLTFRNATALKVHEFHFSRALKNWYLEQEQEREMRTLVIKDIPGLPFPLFPYQSLGVQWIDDHDGRALLADEMGLGKTVQALAWCQLYPERLPILVICPSILKVNWQREAEKWIPGISTQILEGQKPYEVYGDLVIINYDILDYWTRELKEVNFQIMIVDEAHYTKNDTAKRTKAFKRLAKLVPHIIALTGTPIENRPIEIYNIVHAIDPTIFPDYVKFTLDYCEGKKGMFGGWDTSGSCNTLKLHRILKEHIMIRRKKSEVLKDLPPKLITIVPLTLDNREEYNKAEVEFVQYISERFEKDLVTEEEILKELKAYAKTYELDVEDDLTDKNIEEIKELKLEKAESRPVLGQMTALQKLAVEGKTNSVIEWIKNFLESGEKLVVFAIHRKVIRELMKAFPDAVRIDGTVTSKIKRQDAMDKFQTDPNCKLFIGNIKAAGIGITLTAASNVVLLQYPWSPGAVAQAVDRVHRITQTKQVTVWNLIGIDTIEEKIIKILAMKEKVLDEVLDGGTYKDVSVANEIIKMYRSAA